MFEHIRCHQAIELVKLEQGCEIQRFTIAHDHPVDARLGQFSRLRHVLDAAEMALLGVV